jgi:hypothetical protein
MTEVILFRTGGELAFNVYVSEEVNPLVVAHVHVAMQLPIGLSVLRILPDFSARSPICPQSVHRGLIG